MKYFMNFAVCGALLLGGCATSPKTFYSDPTKPDATALCRAALDPSSDYQFRVDVSRELVRRGLTTATCQEKVNTQNAVLVGAALVGVTSAAIIACSNSSCAGGGAGGGYFRDKDCYGGSGNGPDWQYGPIYVGSYDPYGLDADHDGWGCEASDKSYGA